MAAVDGRLLRVGRKRVRGKLFLHKRREHSTGAATSTTARCPRNFWIKVCPGCGNVLCASTTVTPSKRVRSKTTPPALPYERFQ